MTREIGGISTLAQNNAIGFVDDRGPAWWATAGTRTENNHFAGAVPMWRVQEILEAATVSEKPIYIEMPDGGIAEVPGRKAITHATSGNVHGIFMDGYTVHQPSELIDMVSPLMGGDVMVGSIGNLKGFAVSYISLEVPQMITVERHGETFRPYLLLATSHDGSMATTIKRIVTRVVCDNTVSVALGESALLQVKLKHTRYSKAALRTAADALGLIEQTADDYMAEMDALIATTVTDRQWSDFLTASVMTDDKGKEKEGRSLTLATNERESLAQLWNNDNRVSPWRGTAWGVLQAVNTYTHHIGIVRNVDRGERNMLRAVTGGVDMLDKSTIATLGKVLANV